MRRLFHRRARSAAVQEIQPLQVQAFRYDDASPGVPPRQGTSPLRGNFSTPPLGNGQLEWLTPASPLSSNPPDPEPAGPEKRHHRSRSLGHNVGQPPLPALETPNLKRSISYAAKIGQGEAVASARAGLHGGPVMAEEDSDAFLPPLPGTALTSDDARYMQYVERQAHSRAAHMSLGGDDRLMARPSRARYGEDVADRSLANQYQDSSNVPVVPDASHAEDIANRNMVENSAEHEDEYEIGDGEVHDLPPPSMIKHRYSHRHSRLWLDSAEDEGDHTIPEEQARDSRPASLRRKKGHSSGLRNLSDSSNDYSVQSLDDGSHSVVSSDRDESGSRCSSRSYVLDGHEEASGWDGAIDLGSNDDVSYHTRYAPAVTHETIYPEVHRIREEVTFREVHTHDVYHRILPIIDVEVLPARHFIPNADGGLSEIPEEDVPGRSNGRQARHWLIAETVSRSTRDERTPTGARQFTARQFRGTEGDERRYVTEEGFERTETTWVHRPTIETGARETGQTEPLYMGPSGATQRIDDDAETEEQRPPRSLKALASGIRDCPFGECIEFEKKEKQGIQHGNFF